MSLHPAPIAGRSCARHMSPLSPTVRGSVPSTRCRGAHGCPASGAGCSPRGAVLGLPGGIASPKSSCGERKAGMSRAEPARGVWDKLSGLDVADEMGRGRLSLQGKRGSAKVGSALAPGTGLGTSDTAPGDNRNPRKSQIFLPTRHRQTRGRLDPCRTPKRSGHPQSCPAWSPWGQWGVAKGQCQSLRP